MVIDVNYLRNRVKEVREIIGELTRLVSKPYSEMSLDGRYSMRYQIIVLAEALGSICLHIALEDLGHEPKSYAEYFRLLENRGLIEYAADLIDIVRLRNLLVHHYWIIDDAKVYEAVKENFKYVENFMDELRNKYGL